MKYCIILLVSIILYACVPAKKYNELLERERVCNEELAGYKSAAINHEDRAKDLDARFAVLKDEVTKLKKDTAQIGEKYRLLQTEYDKMVLQNIAYEFCRWHQSTQLVWQPR